MPPRPEFAIDHGRLTGATAVLNGEFNCRSQWSDARERCSELEFMVTNEHTLDRAYKVPSLRNVVERAPHMNARQFATLADVLDHYNRGPPRPLATANCARCGSKPSNCDSSKRSCWLLQAWLGALDDFRNWLIHQAA